MPVKGPGGTPIQQTWTAPTSNPATPASTPAAGPKPPPPAQLQVKDGFDGRTREKPRMSLDGFGVRQTPVAFTNPTGLFQQQPPQQDPSLPGVPGGLLPMLPMGGGQTEVKPQGGLSGSLITSSEGVTVELEANAGLGAEQTLGEEGPTLSGQFEVYGKLSLSLTHDAVNPEGASTTFEVTGDVGASITAGGEAEIQGVDVSLEHASFAGNRVTFEVTVPMAAAEAIRTGAAPIPNPFDPTTLPEGGVVTLESSHYSGTGMEASFERIASLTLSGQQETSQGTAIAVERLSPTTVRITAGPTEAVAAETSAGVGLVGSLTLARTQEQQIGDLRTVEIDITHPEGLAAYQRFLATGEVPASDPASGISHSGRILNVDMSDETALTAQLGPFGIEASGRNEGTFRLTEYDDGSRVLEGTVSYEDVSSYQRITLDANGQETRDPTVISLGPVSSSDANFLTTVATGQEPQQSVPQGRMASVTVTLTPEGIDDLQRRAREYQERYGPGQSALVDTIAAAQTPQEVERAFLIRDSGKVQGLTALGTYNAFPGEAPFPFPVTVTPLP